MSAKSVPCFVLVIKHGLPPLGYAWWWWSRWWCEVSHLVFQDDDHYSNDAVPKFKIEKRKLRIVCGKVGKSSSLISRDGESQVDAARG